MSLFRSCCCSGCQALDACGVQSDVVQFSTSGNDPTYPPIGGNPVTGVTLSSSSVSMTQTGGSISRSNTPTARTIVTWNCDIEIDYTFTPDYAGGFETDCACFDGSTFSDLPSYSGTAQFSVEFQYVCIDANDGGTISIPQNTYYIFGDDYVDCDRPLTTKPPVNGPEFLVDMSNAGNWTQSVDECGDVTSSYFDAELNFKLTSTGDCGTTTTPGTEYSDPLTLTVRLGFE